MEASRSEFFCTYVRVLEVLFKIKCCGKGSILFFRTVIFHYYVWHGYNKRLLQTSFLVFLNEPGIFFFPQKKLVNLNLLFTES